MLYDGCRWTSILGVPRNHSNKRCSPAARKAVVSSNCALGVAASEELSAGAPSVGQASLPVCLARALLELNGASLIEMDDPCSTWRALTVLKCVAQQDFFAALPEPAPRRMPAPALCEAACA